MCKKRYVQKAFMTATPGPLKHQSKVASIIQELFISVLVEPFQCLWVVFIGHSLGHKRKCHYSVEIYLPMLSLPSCKLFPFPSRLVYSRKILFQW